MKKYYIYRNLHKNMFSVKYDGKVIKWTNFEIIKNVEFKVSQKGRERVIKEKRKNVHATIAGDLIDSINLKNYELIELYYNPYITETFQIKYNKEPIYNADLVLVINNKMYLLI